MNVYDQKIRNRQLPDSYCGTQVAIAIEYKNRQVHHWCTMLFTYESRFTLNTCDKHKSAIEAITLLHFCNNIQHDWFDGGSEIG